jgi:hypothetical protein
MMDDAALEAALEEALRDYGELYDEWAAEDTDLLGEGDVTSADVTSIERDAMASPGDARSLLARAERNAEADLADPAASGLDWDTRYEEHVLHAATFAGLDVAAPPTSSSSSSAPSLVLRRVCVCVCVHLSLP